MYLTAISQPCLRRRARAPSAVRLALLLPLAAAILVAPRISAAAAKPGPVISDLGPASFGVFWSTSKPFSGRVDMKVEGKTVRFQDVRGDVTSRVHLVDVACGEGLPCQKALRANTAYRAVVYSDGSRVATLSARTTPVLSPLHPLSSIGGHVRTSGGKPAAAALLYVIARHGKLASVPLATLTLGNGTWLVALANAVTANGKTFPLKKGDTILISATSGLASGSEEVTLTSVDRPVLIKAPLVLN